MEFNSFIFVTIEEVGNINSSRRGEFMIIPPLSGIIRLDFFVIMGEVGKCNGSVRSGSQTISIMRSVY